MSGRSVNLTTLFLGRFRPPKRLTSTSCTYFRQLLTTALLEKAKGETKVCCQSGYRTQDLRVRCPTDCATPPGHTVELQWLDVGGRVVRWSWINFQVRGVLLVWIRVGQGPTALAVGVGGGCLDIFTLIYPVSFLSPSLWETTRYRP